MAKNEDNEELLKLEEELKALEALDKTSDTSSIYGTPEPEKKDSMFKFFREILKIKEPWKVGNLKDPEIGNYMLSVRSNLELASYLEKENWDLVSGFFTKQAQIVGETSMGRKGFMAQLFVTQIKKEQKLKDPPKEKKGWFGGRKNEPEE